MTASKIIREWSGRQEIFSRPHVIENSRQYLLLRTDILQKTVVGCPCTLAVFTLERDYSSETESIFKVRQNEGKTGEYKSQVDCPSKIKTIPFSN